MLTRFAGIRIDALEKTRHKANLFGMYVAPDHRGVGLARQLIVTVLDYARLQGGVSIVQLNLVEGNTQAQNLYNSCGFEAFATEPRAIRCDGQYRSIIHMQKYLGEELSK